jgi:hypothetical protein
MRRSIFLSASLWLVVAIAHSLEAAVISEIYYNTPNGSERLEFIEISADTSTPEDVSGWAFVEGIQYVFPPATILKGGGVIVVCKDVEAVGSHYGIDNALGNYTGSLDGAGERITLVNQVGAVIQSVRYDDDGKWPVGADGTGYTLSLISRYLDPREPESWQRSVEFDGTPGRPTFAEVDPFDREPVVLIEAGAVWNYREGTGPFSDGPEDWHQTDFDDSAWSSGATPIGNRYGDEKTLLDDLPGNYSTVACRAHFQLDDTQIEGVTLAVQFDDGLCAWVNGEEVARAGCPEGADWDSTATTGHSGVTEVLFSVPRGALRVGDNVIALLGLNLSIRGFRFRLNPRVLHTPGVPGPPPSPGVVFNELFRGPSATDGWVELFNATAGPVNLGGYQLTDDAERHGANDTFTFPPETSMGPGDFLVVDETSTAIDFAAEELRLFLLRPDRSVVTAHVFGRSPPPELAPGTYSQASFPDGDRRGWLTRTPTSGMPNEVAREENLVINEIFYHPPNDPVGEPRSEFLELFNRGTTPIDLTGFRFNRGIDYLFEGTGASIGPGQYLVLAKEPALLAEQHGYDGALGPYEGVLSNSGENVRLIDRLGNLVDEVRYFEGGEWSLWADGRGASLELMDPFQDNDCGAAWDASDESEKASWEELSYSVEDHIPFPPTESELHLFLVEKGICLIDDVSVSRDGGENIIPNPGFEDETTLPWVIGGTHIYSDLNTTDSHSGQACLEVVATGSGNSRVNRIEVDTDPGLSLGPYDVSLWARWQRGTSVIVTHSDFTSAANGDPMGNTLGARSRMTVPFNLGTPGEENSVRRDSLGQLRNLGPVIDELIHSPAVPVDSERVAVRARVRDPDGVAEVRVFFRADPDLSLQSQPLLDDGLDGDRQAGDGVYGARLPGFEAGTALGFYVEATDTPGNVLTLPREAPDQTNVIRVVNASDLRRRRDRTRILLDAATTDELRTRQLHSNNLVHGTFVFNESQIYYNVGVRYRGSPWGRTARDNFRVRFAPDRRFIRGFKDFNITKRGVRDGSDEGAAYFVIGRVGTPEHSTAVPDYFYVDGYYNQRSMGLQAGLEPVNNAYISKWYGDNITGPVLKADGRQQFNDAGAMDMGRIDWASLTYKGENPESYRHYWKHSIGQSDDNWQPFIDLCKLMDPRETPDELFDITIDDVLDVERFFRVHAARILMGDDDALFIANGHNGYLVRDSSTGLWSLLPFDIDGRFKQSTSLFRTVDRAIARLFARPPTRRTYYRVLSDYVDGYWSAEKVHPWLEALEEATGMRSGDIESSLTTTHDFLREELLQLERGFTILPALDYIVDLGTLWAFRKGTRAFSDPPTAWREPDFDDSSWARGPTPFGYGESIGGAVLSDMKNRYTTLALRKRFVIPPQIIDEEFGLEIAYDDGFCAYLNGQELARQNCGAPGEDVAWDARATSATEISLSKLIVPIPREMLVVGENIIAILGLNQTLSGADFAIVPRIFLKPKSVFTSETTARLQGQASVQVATFHSRINGGPAQLFKPTWTSVVTWEAKFELEQPTSRIEILGLDGREQLLGSGSIVVVSTAFDTFQRAEVTGDGVVDINDALAILGYLFQHGQMSCLDAADVEDDGRVTVLDAIRIVLFLFAQGQEPAAPFTAPGPDPTADALGCGR